MVATRVWLVMIWIALSPAAAAVGAQEVAGTFDQLRVLVKPGDRITVTDNAGREMRGTIADLSPSSLVLLVGRERRDLPASEVNTIWQRRPDPLANGAKWGLGVGAGLGVLAGLALSSEYEGGDDRGALVAVATLIYGGLGAAVGVGVDALISGNQVIYARRAAGSARVTVAPRVTPHRQRITVSVGF